MANYTESIEYKHEVLSTGVIQVRKTTVTFKDGERIAEGHHRHTLMPGEDLSKEAPETVAIARVVWTPEVIAAYQQLMAENEQRRFGGQSN